MAEGGLRCEPGETYIMNVMVSGHPYWVPVFEGFKQAAEALGCEAEFSGTPDYDITKQIASFEQDLVTNPKGILLHPMQADPFIDPINRAIDAGVSVTTFAADSPKSKRTAYITSDNLAEAAFAAEEIVKAVGDSAENAVLENPGQSNHDLRVTALIAYMEKNYPNMKLVGRQATNQDPNAAFTAVFGDVACEPRPCRAVDSGVRFCRRRRCGGQGGGRQAGDHPRRHLADHAGRNQGRQHSHGTEPRTRHPGLHRLHEHLLGAHPDLIDPFNDYKTSGYNPMQIPLVDNGFAVITKDNADSFVLEAYIEGRN